MAIATLYDHTVNRFSSGLNAATDTYTICLYSALTFNPAHTTKAAVDAAATQLATGNGYTQDAKTLANASIAVVTTNDSKFDADDPSWTASGGAIGPAVSAVIFNTTDANSPPVVRIDFEGAKTADNGTPFNVTFNPSGIVLFSYT